jgi:hypothetical protein
MRSLCVAFGLCLALIACGGDDDGGGGKDCDAYCTTIMANCTGGNAQYGDVAQCKASCEALSDGEEGAMAGNSAACRTYHAGAAEMDPVTHCVHAGPGGAGACGANCEGFCTIALEECPDAFDSAADCATKCAAYDATVKYEISQTGGDTLACRLYHLTVATTMPAPHCTHIIPDSSTCN